MGELILCNAPIAAVPYYMEALSINLYSLEELCYVMQHHSFLLDEEIFDEELILWLEEEAGEKVLADNLRQSLEKKLGLADLAECIFRETGYFSGIEKRQILEQIKQVENKSVFERRKMRADRYAESGKYASALQEYRIILQMEEDCRKNPIMCGNIWHNQGVIFTRFFLYKEAKECFEMAYKYHMNPESIRAAKAAGELLEDAADGKFLEEVEALEERDTLQQVVEEWKREYQKNCK